MTGPECKDSGKLLSSSSIEASGARGGRVLGLRPHSGQEPVLRLAVFPVEGVWATQSLKDPVLRTQQRVHCCVNPHVPLFRVSCF